MFMLFFKKKKIYKSQITICNLTGMKQSRITGKLCQCNIHLAPGG